MTTSYFAGHSRGRAAVFVFALALLPVTIACSGGESITGPSSTPTATTRVISVSGNLAFGDVPVGSQRSLSYTITNTGNATLTVSGTTISGGLASQTLFSWTSGQIAAGSSQLVTVRFQPTAAGTYSGTITVMGDHTSGSNTVSTSGSATAALAGNWAGQYVVERCDGTGSNQDYFCSARGAFPPGSSLPISLSLSQNGPSVTGTILLGQVSGVVSGAVNASGTLVLQGSASAGTLSLALSSWNTTTAGTSMNGTFAYNAGLSGVPGTAVIVSRLSGVTRR